jgi:hypothetical protein
MQTVVWTPRLFLAACALAIGVVAATPDGGADDSGSGGDAAAPGDATIGGDAGAAEDAATADSCPGTGNTYEAGGANAWAGPPSDDGSLDDGFMPAFTLDNGNALDYLGVCQTLPTPFAYTTVQAPYKDATGCMAFNAQGHTASHNCLCQKCFTLMQECDSLAACQAIWKCSQDSGCTTANACYLYPGAPCIDVINSAGTGSVATGLESNLSTCGVTNGCPAK